MGSYFPPGFLFFFFSLLLRTNRSIGGDTRTDCHFPLFARSIDFVVSDNGIFARVPSNVL